VAESARNTRQELQNLDPTVRLAQLGRTYPTGPRRAEPGEVFALAEKMQQEQLLPADPRFSGFAPASTRAPSQRTMTLIPDANGRSSPVETRDGVISNCARAAGDPDSKCQMCAGKCLSPRFAEDEGPV